MLKRVDYNERQHQGYAKARALPQGALAAWMDAFARRAPPGRPLRVLDLGSGVGRFSPALADTFGGPVFGVEPADAMRAVAEAEAPHPRVRYLAGRAEQIPLPDGGVDLVLMYLSFHHVQDKPAAVREIVRTLAPGGRVFVRSTFADRMPELDWHRYFPSARAIELRMFPTLAETLGLFAAAGLRRLALDEVETAMAANLKDYAERLKLRAISTFEHLEEAEIEQGFRDLDAAVAAAEGEQVPITYVQDLLVLG